MRRAELLGPKNAGRWAAALLWLCGLFAAAPTWAQDEPVALTWTAPAGCSSARDVLARIRKLTKAAPLPERQLHAEATVEARDHKRLHLTLVVRAGELVGERAIRGRSCDDLAGATAVVLALLLRSAEPLQTGDLQLQDGSGGASGASAPDAVSTTRTPDAAAASSVAAVQATPDASPDPTTEGRADSEEARRWRIALQLPIVTTGVGPLPGPSFAFSLAGGVSWRRWSLLAESGVWLTQTLEAADQPDARAEVHRVEAAVRGCWGLPLGRFELAPCLRVALQHLWARGTGARVDSQPARTSWVAAALGVQGHYQIASGFRVFSRADVHFLTARPRLAIDGVGKVAQLWPVALTLSLGTEWNF